MVDLKLPVGGFRLTDKFEWDICNPDNCAEEFAHVLLSELSVAEEENVHALANLIKSQIEFYCTGQALDLKQNVVACCQEDKSDESDVSDCGENLTNLTKPPAPVRKRDWKALSKSIKESLNPG